MGYKIAAVALVFLGETLSVIGELFASRHIVGGHFLAIFLYMTLVMVFGGAALVGGYMLGYLYFKNIWIVIAVSLGTLAIGEPLLAVLLFGETPTLGSIIGLVLGILGLAAALFIP